MNLKTPMKRAALAALFAAASALPMAGPANAGTPKDMLLLAKNNEDLIRLAPAEGVRFTGR